MSLSSAERDREPTESLAADLAANFSGRPPRRVQRFPTGLAHWVYDVVGAGEERLVVRIGRSSQPSTFAPAVYWSGVLRPLGIPLPQLLGSGEWASFPYMILERLSGSDRGLVYAGLSLDDKHRIAAEICRIQAIVGSLRPARGYGFLARPTDTGAQSWRSVVDGSIARSRSRIEAAGAVDPDRVNRLARSVSQFDGYFAGIPPTPFLDDTTTKNVIVEQGSLTGIVDVDCLCFGDPLLPISLTRTSLLCSGYDTQYTDYWLDLLDPSEEQRAAVRFYTALFCVDFLSEIGQTFNDAPEPLDQAVVDRLERVFDDHLVRS
jgi:aminoglycoside phosphotransferase (APT) family kinase protein